MHIRHASLGIALTAIAQTLSPATAAADDVQPVRIVRYGDLDLTRTAGQSALKRRTDGAIRAVCPDPDERDLGMLAQHQQCLAVARKAAQEQVAAVIAASVQMANGRAEQFQLARR